MTSNIMHKTTPKSQRITLQRNTLQKTHLSTLSRPLFLSISVLSNSSKELLPAMPTTDRTEMSAESASDDVMWEEW